MWPGAFSIFSVSVIFEFFSHSYWHHHARVVFVLQMKQVAAQQQSSEVVRKTKKIP